MSKKTGKGTIMRKTYNARTGGGFSLAFLLMVGLPAAVLTPRPALAQLNQGDACSVSGKVYTIDMPGIPALYCDGANLQYFFPPKENGALTCNAAAEGALQYIAATDTWNFCNGTIWTALASGGGGGALSSITAATAANTINNAAWAQAWNWALGAAGTGFTFGESTASTGGANDQYILAAKTLSASTAMPFYIQNLGAGRSFQVDDAAGDTTPFYIDESGAVTTGHHLTIGNFGNISLAGGSYIQWPNNAGGSIRGGGSGATGYFEIITSNTQRMVFDGAGNVGIGTKAPANPLSVWPQQYATGTASQSLTTVTGVGTTWTSAMVGSQLVFADGTSAGTITAFGSATSLTVSTSQTVTSQGYVISYTGLNVDSTGKVGIGTTTPTAQLEVTAASATTIPLRLRTAPSQTAYSFDIRNSSGITTFHIGSGGIVYPHTDVRFYSISVPSIYNQQGAAGSGLRIAGSQSADSYLSLESSRSGGGSGDYINFKVGNLAATEAMRIVSSGNVGIGTATPGVSLDVGSKTDAIRVPNGTAAQAPTCTGLAGGIRYQSDGTTGFYGCDGTSWSALASGGGGGALSSITAATATNTIDNGVNEQVWNWALTGATADAFTFTENTASTGGSGDQSILKAATIATSTAVPLMVTNAGDGASFRVNDSGSDTDSSPFIIDAAGNVGIGTATPYRALVVQINGATENLSLINRHAVATSSAGLTFDHNRNGGALLAGDLVSEIKSTGSNSTPATTLVSNIVTTMSDVTAGAESGQLSFQTRSGGTLADRLTIGSNGNVGIGTATPGSMLQVAGDITPSANLTYSLGSNTLAFATGYFNGIYIGGGNGIYNPNGTAAGQIGFSGSSGANGAISFNVNSATQMYINNGNVGIGTKAPSNPLSVWPQQYSTGTASQSLTTVTGVGTTWTSAMVGSQFVFADGTSAGTITAFGSATSLTVSTSQTVTSQGYVISYTGLNVDSTGNVGIGTATPGVSLDVGSKTDAIRVPNGTAAQAPTCTGLAGGIRYQSDGTTGFYGCDGTSWSALASGGGGSDIFEVTGAAGSEVVSSIDANVPYATADFVFGSPQLDDDTNAAHDARMFFDKSKAAFRAGTVTGTQWDDANIGSYSVAMGYNTTASGNYSTAMGQSTTSSGSSSTAMGQSTTSSGSSSTAMGFGAAASGNYSIAAGFGVAASGSSSTAMGSNTIASGINSIAIGNLVTAGNGTALSGLGDGSMALGLIDDAVVITTKSQVTGIQSMGIFMGDQDGLVVSANNQMSLLGGKMVIDPAVPATDLTADTALDVNGSIKVGNGGETCGASYAGAIRYNTGAVELCDGTSWAAIGGGGTPAGANTQIQFNNSGAFGASANLTWSGTVFNVTGDITYSGTITDTSDIRLKENVAKMGGSLEKLTSLEAISFTMKDDEAHRTEFGFSAQDMQKIYPELVQKADDEMGTLSVNYIGLIAPMVDAIKELETQNKALSAQNHILLQRLEAIETKLNTDNPL